MIYSWAGWPGGVKKEEIRDFSKNADNLRKGETGKLSLRFFNTQRANTQVETLQRKWQERSVWRERETEREREKRERS